MRLGKASEVVATCVLNFPSTGIPPLLFGVGELTSEFSRASATVRACSDDIFTLPSGNGPLCHEQPAIVESDNAF
jgi:hypothetical protein